jgi:hypothetical protein
MESQHGMKQEVKKILQLYTAPNILYERYFTPHTILHSFQRV